MAVSQASLQSQTWAALLHLSKKQNNAPNWQWPPRLLSTGELCPSRWLLQLLVRLVKQQRLALERMELHSCGDSWSGVVWCFRSYSMKTDLRLLWLYCSHLTLFLSLSLVQRKENLFGRPEAYFSLSPPCLAECMQYLGGNRQRQGKELTVKNEYILMVHFGSTDLGTPLIVPFSDLVKMERREILDIGLLGRTQPSALETKRYGAHSCLLGEPLLCERVWEARDRSCQHLSCYIGVDDRRFWPLL